MTGDVEVEDVAIPLDRDSGLRMLVRIFRPDPVGPAVIVLVPGGVDHESADALARRLAARIGAAVVMPEPLIGSAASPVPGASAALLEWLTEQGQRRGLSESSAVILAEDLTSESGFETAVSRLSVDRVQGKAQGISG